jgi:hypothetical protein
MDLQDELLKLIDRVNAEQVDYAICGGLAVAIHGYPRFTKDIDLLVRAPDLPRLAKILGALGFTLSSGRLLFGAGTPRQREIHRFSKAQGRDLLTVDLLLVNAGLEDAWGSRQVFDWRGRRVQVVSPEGLAHLKRLAGREQDLLDLKQLGFDQDGAPGE